MAKCNVNTQERFADIQMLRYELKGFENLSLTQKIYIYCLSKATLLGRDITFDQQGKYNLRIRKTLEAVYRHYEGNRESEDFKAFEVYLKRVWFASGIHHHYGCEKFVPGFSEESFYEMVEAIADEYLPLSKGQSKEDLLGILVPVIFNPEVMPKRVNQTDGEDLVQTSACNFYENVSQAEVERFYARMKEDGNEQEAIRLVYKNNSELYVGLHSLHKISKYKGKDGVPPVVNKLGGDAWNKLKQKTKSRVKDIARELIALYARRKKEAAFAFSKDSYLQEEMEVSFMYDETPDQIKAIEAVKADMEKPQVMDRLICGDVGFGKTEVAIRAAFKAVADSKQVAVLVPTTVLAYQHYHTFSRRLEGMPCRVEYISRMKKSVAALSIFTTFRGLPKMADRMNWDLVFAPEFA